MGFGVAGALGAKLAAPDHPVVAVVGDSGFLMHANVVATAVEYDLPVLWIVWNNGGYVSNRDIQVGFFGKDREFATRFRSQKSGELLTADFALLAQSMGAQSMGVEAARVETLEGYAGAFRAACARRGPFLIELRI